MIQSYKSPGQGRVLLAGKMAPVAGPDLLGLGREVDWALGGAAFGFTAGLVQLFASTALTRLTAQSDTELGGTNRVVKSTERRKYQEYDYEDYLQYQDYYSDYHNMDYGKRGEMDWVDRAGWTRTAAPPRPRHAESVTFPSTPPLSNFPNFSLDSERRTAQQREKEMFDRIMHYSSQV